MKNILKIITTVTVVFIISLTVSSPVLAYTCKAVFNEAQTLIKEADAMVNRDTDSRIKALIAEAKGMAQAGIVSHADANERHTGPTGKYAHGDSVRKGRQAVSLAKEALFLLDGKPR